MPVKAATQARGAGAKGLARPTPGWLASRPFAMQREQTGGVRETEQRQPTSVAAGPSFSFGKLALQPKLTVGRSDDPFEQEADRVAERVMRMPGSSEVGVVLQRKCSSCEEEDKLQRRTEDKLQRRTMGTPVGEIAPPPIVNDVLRSPGRPLDPVNQAFFESRLGYQLDGVRVHVDRAAAASAASVEALAYTVGRHVVFSADRFQPGTQEGKRLVAHELAHVVQQGQAPRLRGMAGTSPLRVRFGTGLTLARTPADGEGTASAYALTLRYPPNQKDHLDHASAQEAASKIRWFISGVEAHIEGGEEGLRYLRKLHDDQWIVAGVSDLLGGFVSIPSMEVWAPAKAKLGEGRAALERGDITAAAADAQSAAEQAHDAETRVYNYREGTIGGAGRAEFGLRVVVVASAAVVAVGTAGVAAGAGGASALAGLGTGAAAGGSASFAGLVGGSAYGAAQATAGQAMEVHGGSRRGIDWTGIGVDAALGLVTGYLGGRLGGGFVKRFLSDPATASFGRRIAVTVLGDLITGRASSIMHSAAKIVIDGATGRKHLTVEGFIDEVIDQLFDPKGAFLDLIMGAAIRRLASGAASSAQHPATGSKAAKETEARPGPQTPSPSAQEGAAGRSVSASGSPAKRSGVSSTEVEPPITPAPSTFKSEPSERFPDRPTELITAPSAVQAPIAAEPTQLPASATTQVGQTGSAATWPRSESNLTSTSADAIGPSPTQKRISEHLENLAAHDIDPQERLAYNAKEWEQFQRHCHDAPGRALDDLERRLDRHGVRAEMSAGERFSSEQEGVPVEPGPGAENLDEPGLMSELDPGYDPNWAPEGQYRFPAANKGEWIKGGQGDGSWQPHDPGAYGLEPGQSVLFREGVPDLREYSVKTPSGHPGTLEVQGLIGDGRKDYWTTVEQLSKQEGITPAECQQWLRDNDLRLHHYSSNEMQIVPGRLHEELAHQGSRKELSQ